MIAGAKRDFARASDAYWHLSQEIPKPRTLDSAKLTRLEPWLEACVRGVLERFCLEFPNSEREAAELGPIRFGRFHAFTRSFEPLSVNSVQLSNVFWVEVVGAICPLL
jgi:hypothetical protein